MDGLNYWYRKALNNEEIETPMMIRYFCGRQAKMLPKPRIIVARGVGLLYILHYTQQQKPYGGVPCATDY